MKFTSKEYGQPIEILKFLDFKGAPCMVSDTGVVADANGLKIVKAGTPINADGVRATSTGTPLVSDAVGILLHDTDVTNGAYPGTYVFEGSINNTKLVANGITVSAEEKAALPRVTFFN